jgi:preprotein translocase subunit SecD
MRSLIVVLAACGGGEPHHTTTPPPPPAPVTTTPAPAPPTPTPTPSPAPPPTVGGTPTVVQGAGGCGDFALYVVDDSSAYMQRAYNGKPSGAVKAEADQWRDDAGHMHNDWYLVSSDRAKLQQYVTDYALQNPVPGDRKIAIEALPAGARTYYLFAKPIVDGKVIAAASVGHDSVSRATVNITLNADGAKALETETNHNIGRKLAIVVNGAVMSAPVIGAGITGGKLAITVGGADPQKGDRDAQVLAAALTCKS